MSFIHGDGLQDVVITGGFKQKLRFFAPKLYLQKPKHLKQFILGSTIRVGN